MNDEPQFDSHQSYPSRYILFPISVRIRITRAQNKMSGEWNLSRQYQHRGSYWQPHTPDDLVVENTASKSRSVCYGKETIPLSTSHINSPFQSFYSILRRCADSYGIWYSSPHISDRVPEASRLHEGAGTDRTMPCICHIGMEIHYPKGGHFLDTNQVPSSLVLIQNLLYQFERVYSLSGKFYSLPWFIPSLD